LKARAPRAPLEMGALRTNIGLTVRQPDEKTPGEIKE
jgi:hypothetical protein